jgi:hypothetical protein
MSGRRVAVAQPDESGTEAVASHAGSTRRPRVRSIEPRHGLLPVALLLSLVLVLTATSTSAARQESRAGVHSASFGAAAATGWESMFSESFVDPVPAEINGSLAVMMVDPFGTLFSRRTSQVCRPWPEGCTADGPFGGEYYHGGSVISTPAVMARPAPNGGSFVFVVGDDGTLWYFDGINWYTLGGLATSSPAAAAIGDEMLVSIIGGDGAVWVRKWTATGDVTNTGDLWSDWQSLGGVGVLDTAMVTHGSSVDLYVVGGDEALWTRRYDGTRWSGWQSLGGVLVSTPAAMTHGSDVFVTAVGADDALWYRRYRAGRWSAWTSLGGIVASVPAAVSHATGADIYVIGADDALWYRRFNGVGFDPWVTLGGVAISNPGAVSYKGVPHVFVVGGDGMVWHTTN